MRGGLRAAAAGLATLALWGGANAGAEELPRPLSLRVAGGEDSWHSQNNFRLEWDRPAASVRAVDYRVRDDLEAVVTEGRIPEDVNVIQHIHVPGPGRYTAEVWLERADGAGGPSERATLLFDNARPAPVRPLTAGGWIGGDSAATVRIEHLASSPPLSGIRGYAVSVSPSGGEPPCSGPDRCSEEETDLPGGADDDTLSLGPLPEGIHIVRAVAVSGSGMRSEEAASATVRVDATRPEVALTGAPLGWAQGPLKVTATATDALSGMVAAGPSGPFTALAVDDGLMRVAEGDSVAAMVSGDGVHTVALNARDAAGNLRDAGAAGAPAPEIVRIDESPPTVAFARSQDPADPERIEASVSDRLSGPDPTRGSIALRPAGSRQRFEPIPTTVSAGRLTARWDSDSFSPGDYEFRATGFDAAGNSGEGERRATGALMVLPNPLKTPTMLEAGFGGRRLVWRSCVRGDGRRRCRRQVIGPYDRRPAEWKVPYGHGVRFGGRLATSAGAPLAGLPVEVIESFDAGANPASRTSTVLTGPDGTFDTHLGPGPSRQVEAVFAGNRVLARTGDDAVRLGVLAAVRLRASASTARIGGAPVVFAGRIGGPDGVMPPGGRPVELQFRLPGTRWAEFRTIQTDGRGRFHYAYSFSDDDSRGVRFQFRAHALSGPGWPYEAASSRTVAVTGR